MGWQIKENVIQNLFVDSVFEINRFLNTKHPYKGKNNEKIMKIQSIRLKKV